jgi:hypothetical protein
MISVTFVSNQETKEVGIKRGGLHFSLWYGSTEGISTRKF